jgi:hypothetical protein
MKNNYFQAENYGYKEIANVFNRGTGWVSV